MNRILTAAERTLYMAKRHLQRMRELLVTGMMDLAIKHYNAAMSLL